MFAMRSSAALAQPCNAAQREGSDLRAAARQQAAPAACRQQRRLPAAQRAPTAPRQSGSLRPPLSRGRAAAAVGPAGELNPQNVDQPLVMPSPAFTPEQAVAAQLDALACNNSPWGNHGVQTAYEFAHDVGGMDPSLYFGIPKDLYHFDHFMGMFLTKLGPLVNHGGFTLLGTRPAAGDPNTLVVSVSVQLDTTPALQKFDFLLRQKKVGPRKGAWTTFMLVAAPA